jgi:hypothetical protein
MPLTKLQFKPGINRETTSYSNEGGWFDGDKVRFRFGYPEKIGGWTKLTPNYFLGTGRTLHGWLALDGSKYLGLGTNLKYYLIEGQGFYDITPIRETTAAGDVTFSASANTLGADVAIGDLTITLTSASGFPNNGRIKINSEIITYEGISSNTLTGCNRGQNGTTAASHTSGDAVLCATIIVSDTNHGAVDFDFVTFSGAATFGGNITANVINQEYQITHIVNANEYYVEARAENTSIDSITITGGLDPSYVFANSSDSGNGGASVVGTYQINVGLDTVVGGTGWGAGAWSRGTWGSAASTTVTTDELRIWTDDNFGEDLLINIRDGGIYYWDASSGKNNRAVELSSLAGSNLAPTIAKQVLISDRDRHVLAFGCDPENDIGTQDPLLIRFSDQESLTDWQSLPTNTAGDLRIGTGSEIIMAVETRQQILVFTDVSLHTLQFLGPPFTFGINTVSQNLTIAGPLAAVSVEDKVYWMGQEEFYVYGGAVQRIPCSVRDYVFSDLNEEQFEKVKAGSNTAFSEVWWFYPSLDSTENDSYVVFNYEQNIWYYGTLNRTAWLDRGFETNPISAGSDNVLYYQESGFDDGSSNPSTAISSYVESSQFDISDGDNFMLVSRLIPDVTFRSSSASSPSVTMTVEVRNFPGGPYTNSTGSAVTKTASVPVEQFTQDVRLRLRGRSMAFKIDSSTTGVSWRLGSPRVDVKPDGRR